MTCLTLRKRKCAHVLARANPIDS